MRAKASWHLVAKVTPSPKSLWTASVQPPVNVAAASGWSLFLELEWTGAWNEDMNLSNTSSLKMRIISSTFFRPCSQRFHGRTGRAIRERWKEVCLEVPLAAGKPATQKRNEQSRWVKYLSSDGKESHFSEVGNTRHLICVVHWSMAFSSRCLCVPFSGLRMQCWHRAINLLPCFYFSILMFMVCSGLKPPV